MRKLIRLVFNFIKKYILAVINIKNIVFLIKRFIILGINVSILFEIEVLKLKKLFYLLIISFCLFLVACGDEDSKTPVEEVPSEEITELPPTYNEPTVIPPATDSIPTPPPAGGDDVSDITMVTFEGIVTDYDGNTYSIECKNVPEGVEVTYIGNDVSEVGEHEVIAILTDSEGNELGTLTAYIIIRNVMLNVPVLSIDEFGNVTWESVEKATHYNYVINDGEVLSTTLQTITLTNEQTISVQAANSDNVSNWSYAVTYFDASAIVEKPTEYVYVKFHDSNIETVKMIAGNKVDRPVTPVKANYTFDNWYADPFYQEVFDFNQEIYSNTIIYANYIPSDLVNDTYFWIKGSPLMSSSVMSSGTASDWHFIPLSVNTLNTTFKEFYATVTVTGATETAPCAFIVMDGFSNDSGRTYWKNGDSDFTINSDGVYNIYFSTEHQYSANIHVYVEQAANQASTLSYEEMGIGLNTPVVSVDSTSNVASWQKVANAFSYEVIIDNNNAVVTSNLSIALPKGSHITVRAVSKDKVSNWSLPKANREVIIEEPVETSASVYFSGYESYIVDLNTTVYAPVEPTLDGYTFGGWYLDVATTLPVTFPYTVTENIVFYPKWIYNDLDYATKVYFNLVTESGTVVKGFTWNLDNYTFVEYESGAVTLEANTNYYVISTSDPTVKYGPYTVSSTGGYKLYFSEDNLWDGKNIYIAATTTKFYITNNKRWGDTLYVYLWNSSTGKPAATWPGVALTKLETNGYGEDIYVLEVDLSLYDMFIISHGSNGVAVSQTIDLKFSDYTTNGFWFKDKNASGKYEVGTWNK